MTIKFKNQILKYLNSLKSFGYNYHEDFDISSFDVKNQNLPNSLAELSKISSNCYLCEL